MMARIWFALWLLVLCAGAAFGAVGPISPATTLAITTGGTWQKLFSANTNRSTLWIENYCTTTSQQIGTVESLFIWFVPPGGSSLSGATTAPYTIGAFELAACGSQTFAGSYQSQQEIDVYAATADHSFAAWQTQ